MIELINEAKVLGWKIEVKKVSDDYLMIRTLNDEVKQFESSFITTYQVKAIVNGKTIVINTENISDYKKIIDEIKNIYEILDNDEMDSLANYSIKDDCVFRDTFNINEIRNDLLSLYNYKNKYKNIINIDSIFNSSKKSTTIINSDNIELSQKTDFKYIYLSVSVGNDKRVSEVSDYYLFNEYNQDDLICFFEKVLNDAINRLEEVSLKSSKYNVIINNNAMYDILNTFKDMFMAKNMNKKLSVLSDKYNSKVFSDKITIVEEPLNDNLKGTYKVLFDSEGTRCQNKVIVEKGKFINKLYDNKEAIKDGVTSTGNSNGVNNMYIVPTNKTFDELLAELNDGVIITDLSGLHSGVNTITGDMSLEAKGYLVKKGKVTKALNSILLSASIFEILGNVIDLSNDLKFGFTHVGTPSILIKDIMIVGEK